jgi:RecB family exonuclease
MRGRQNPWSRWSASKLSALQKCPKYFEFEYILRMQDEVKQGLPKLFGTTMHHMFDSFFSLKHGYKSLMSFLGAFRWEWLTHTIKIKYKDRVRYKDKEEIQKYLAIGINVLKKFWHENQPYRIGKLPMPRVEQSFNMMFKGHRITGKIDRIQPVENGEYEIWDYKTGYKKPTEGELVRDIQFTAYNLALFKETGRNPIKMRLIHPFSGEQFFVPIRTDNDFIQLGYWLDEARTYVQNILEPWRTGWKDLPFEWFNPEDIKRKAFPKRPSSFCNLCDYEELCRSTHPTDDLRKRWVEQELKITGINPQFTQLDLFPQKKKAKKP